MALDTPPRIPFPEHIGRRFYSYEHFTGAQINIIIGDVTVDEIFALEYSVQQNKVPIYGYANQYFNVVAPGTVLVTGRFMMNYTNVMYLPGILMRFMDSRATESTEQVEEAAVESRRPTGPIGSADPSTGVITGSTASTGSFSGETSSEDELETARRVSSMSDAEVERARRAAITRFASEAPNDEGLYSSNLVHGTRIDQVTFRNHRRADQYPGFDIQVHAGSRQNRRSNFTARTILDAHIIGDGQQMMLDGQPIAVEYNFIARSVR